MPTPPLLPTELARRAEGRIESRPTPVRARWSLAEMVTADGHRLRCSFACSVQALATGTEQKMLAEAFLSKGGSVFVDDVIAHFAPALQAAGAKAAATLAAVDLFGDPAKPADDPATQAASKKSRDAITAALRKAGDAVAFSCGLELLAPFQLDVESPSFHQQKIEAMERQLAERRVAGQVEHFERAAALLKQFEAIRQAAPTLSPGAILEQIGTADRGSMLQTLLMAAAKEGTAQDLWGVAGPYLVKFDARSNPIKADLIPLPATLGPLRSVQRGDIDGQRVLLVGARGGILVVRPESPNDAQAYHDPELASQLGFSRALVWNGGLWACHGEGGVVGWRLGQTDAPHVALRPVHLNGGLPAAPSFLGGSAEGPKLAGARNLAALDESRLVFSVGGRVMTVNAAGEVTKVGDEPRADVLAILPDGKDVVVVHEDGTSCARDRSTLAVKCDERRSGKLCAAGVLPWLGSVRLLLATEDGPVQCVGTEDTLVTQYVSHHHGLRGVTGAPDVLAAISADRQRLVVWQSWDGRKPAAELSVAALAKHRLADIDFA